MKGRKLKPSVKAEAAPWCDLQDYGGLRAWNRLRGAGLAAVCGVMKTKALAGGFRLWARLMAGVMLAGSCGCATGGAGSAVAYMRGDLDATLSVPFERAVRASDLAVEQLRFEKVSEKKDALQAILVSRCAADKRVEIRIEKIDDEATKLRIRVGAFGDESIAVATYSQINANL